MPLSLSSGTARSQVWRSVGLVFWPTGLWTSRCSALCGVPLLWYLRFGETSELLDPYSCLHPGSPAYLPIPANACRPSSWVLIGIWAVFGMTVLIFLQFIVLNLYNTAILTGISWLFSSHPSLCWAQGLILGLIHQMGPYQCQAEFKTVSCAELESVHSVMLLTFMATRNDRGLLIDCLACVLHASHQLSTFSSGRGRTVNSQPFLLMVNFGLHTSWIRVCT